MHTAPSPALAALLLLGGLLLHGLNAAESEKIVPKLPAIPSREFRVTEFGAVGDGIADETKAFRSALAACEESGGGRVVVPEGTFVSGPMRLGNGCDLHLSKGAVLKMSQREVDFPSSGRERQAFISATDSYDVQISGEGAIDGQGQPWWEAFRRTKGTEGAKSEPRRPQMIAITRCERVMLQGFKTVNPPNTHVSLRQCQQVTIEGLTMRAPEDSPNTDALNLNIRHAVIRNCDIATGDDNIVFLASAPGSDGAPGVENILVTNCAFGWGHGLSVGSFTSGGVRNIVGENLVFDGTTAGLRLKAARGRGGVVENLHFRNFTMRNVKNPIYFSSYYPKEPKHPSDDHGDSPGPKTPLWRNISVEKGAVSGSTSSMIIWGLPEAPFTGVLVKDVSIQSRNRAAIYHAKGLRLENVTVSGPEHGEPDTFNADIHQR